jgi:hypothetical protein
VFEAAVRFALRLEDEHVVTDIWIALVRGPGRAQALQPLPARSRCRCAEAARARRHALENQPERCRSSGGSDDPLPRLWSQDERLPSRSVPGAARRLAGTKEDQEGMGMGCARRSRARPRRRLRSLRRERGATGSPPYPARERRQERARHPRAGLSSLPRPSPPHLSEAGAAAIHARRQPRNRSMGRCELTRPDR